MSIGAVTGLKENQKFIFLFMDSINICPRETAIFYGQ